MQGQFADIRTTYSLQYYCIYSSGASQTPCLQVPLTGGRWMTRWHRCNSQPLNTGEPQCLNQRHVELGGGVVLTICWPHTLEVSTMNLSGGAGTRCSCSSFKRVLQWRKVKKSNVAFSYILHHVVLFCNHRLRDGCDCCDTFQVLEVPTLSQWLHRSRQLLRLWMGGYGSGKLTLITAIGVLAVWYAHRPIGLDSFDSKVTGVNSIRK